jgi:hypothetical protein
MLTLRLSIVAAALFSVVSGVTPNRGATPPQNLGEFECAVNTFAQKLAAAKFPSIAAAAADALNLGYVCNSSSFKLTAAISAALDRETARVAAKRAEARPKASATMFYVSPNGSDTAPGTLAAPFLTLTRAAAAARALAPQSPGLVGVGVLPGTYFLGDAPLILGAADSFVAWSAYNGGAVTLSGARNVSGLTWAPAQPPVNPAVRVASLQITDARADAWREAHADPGPPPLVQSLFVNGQRQPRARFPNANADDASGICFAATQRPLEGCAGWSNAAVGETGTQPAPAGVTITHVGPDRGDSPTLGCAQCHGGGSFKYSIYPYPENHPVYDAPLPGIGWRNNSLFSFWGSPFSRPAGVLLDPRADNGFWEAAVNFSHPEDAVVHMFHGGLWGGWSFRARNITAVSGQHAPQALPSGISLWLRADDLVSLANGAPVMSWPDAAPGTTHSATANDTAKAPVFHSATFPGGLPCVHFNGSSILSNAALQLGTDKTIFVVALDSGTTTEYGSGLFRAWGSDNGLGTKVADAVAANDDDPAPVGSTIRALMLDWAGSPADPGHRSLQGKPTVLTASFERSATTGFVDGCEELSVGAHGDSSVGYDVGSRGDEMGRYFIGDVAEVLVFSRVLTSAERTAVNAYLWSKWKLPPAPKHCDQPSNTTAVTINFAYGGYQEARGSSISPGQHFYIENQLELLDSPGEWFYDARESQIYIFPNGTDVASAELAVPLADAIVRIENATGVSFSGFTFTASRNTYLEMYEVPSGGDWSLHRGAAVFVQDSSNIAIVGNKFAYTGGNGLMFSNSVVDSNVTDCEFTHTGDSAIVFVGSTNGVDGSAPTYPNRNLVARNAMHEWGIYGKQTSCFAQQLTSNSTIVDNVCFNGPRAGVNFNDQHGGGNTFVGNVVFNAVRETSDHGGSNSWNRQPYWTMSHVADGFNDPLGRSFIGAWDTNSHNLMLNGYNGVWTFDHDDDSQFVRDTDNFMIFGGCKNYLGHHKNCSDNVILYPGIASRSAGSRKCQTDDNGQFAVQFHEGNVCATADGDFYSFSGCTQANLASSVYVTSGNTLLADATSPTPFASTCGVANFSAWVALSQDAGSKLGVTPSVDELILLGAAKVLQFH